MGRSVYEFSYKERRALRRKILVVVCFVLLLMLLTALLFQFLLFPVSVKSNSMYPCADRNSVMLVSPVASFDRGDAVVVSPHVVPKLNMFKRLANIFVAFFTFQQYKPFNNRDMFTETSVLRRVVGVPGDTVFMKDYVLYVRPSGSQHFLTEFELSDKSYDINISDVPASWDDTLGVSGSMPEKTLRSDEYFLLCDNRTSGVDSRIWGVVAGRNIVGRALIQYFPLSRFGLM